MSTNSSSSYIDPNSYGISCIIDGETSIIYVAFFITNILLLLPVCILVFLLGLQRQCSTSSAVMATHSDVFTFQMTAMELVCISGYILCCVGMYTDDLYMLFAGNVLWTFNSLCELFFQVLTCLERYLAVVHPVTYRNLRGGRGVRIRNISSVCVWLLTAGVTGLLYLINVFAALGFFILILSLIIISFSSISVLFVLIRPSPGQHCGEGEKGNQSRRRAFYTILSILAVLSIRVFLIIVLEIYNAMKETTCWHIIAALWFTIPSSLVLPLLYLQRAKTLACCKKN